MIMVYTEGTNLQQLTLTLSKGFFFPFFPHSPATFKSGFTWRPGEIENFRHMTKKSPIPILVLRDSQFNGKLCGVLFFPQYFYFAEKITKY